MPALVPCLLFATILSAQGGDSQALPTGLGTDPMALIRLTPPGCWDGLLLGVSRHPPGPARRTTAGATVEVWDLAYRESPRQETFSHYLEALRARLSQGFAAPPSSHGKIELAELVFSDPSTPQKLDLTRVKSMQERYNRLPPSGSPVKPR